MKYSFIRCFKKGEPIMKCSPWEYFIKLIIFSFPFILFFGLYFVWDPFKVIYNYDNYYQEKDNFIFKNRDFVSSEIYMRNYQKNKYDSFIFGSSTSLFFLPSSWKKYLDSSSHVFSFDASGENIVGIWSKIRFIHQKNNQIKNALLIFDTGGTFGSFTNTGHIFRKHYRIYPSSFYSFHYESFMSYLNFKFILAVIHHKISHRYYPYMKDLLEDRDFTFDLNTNEIIFKGPERELKEDSIGYYQRRSDLFYKRNNTPSESKQMINDKHLQMLREIKSIFISDETDYRIIISPLYEQVSFNKEDLKKIQNIFGRDKVFDYSGINFYTKNMSNYFDPVHFKTYMGDDILYRIYHHSDN
jgi:hypothetical protein